MTSQLLHRKTPNGMNMAVRARRSLQACVMGNRFLHSKQPVRCIIKSILLKQDVDEESGSDDSSTFGGSIGSTGSWCWEREKDLWAEDVEEDEKALIMFDNTMLKEGNIDDREVEDIIVSGFNDEDDLQLLHKFTACSVSWENDDDDFITRNIGEINDDNLMKKRLAVFQQLCSPFASACTSPVAPRTKPPNNPKANRCTLKVFELLRQGHSAI